MLFQRYMTGRGTLGYGFVANTTKLPNTNYLRLRASDTGDSLQPLLEILTTNYQQIAVIGSFYDRQQNNGYTDVLFPDPSAEDEWKKILKNPGILLYLPHINKTDFLETSSKGTKVSLGDGIKLDIPEISHHYDNRFREVALSDDMMADLVADVWYAASLRLSNPNQPGTWPVINICVTDENEADKTLEIGREFFCNILMEALPISLRSVVSVSIGGRYSDMSNATNGGSAAVLIARPEEKPDLVPGTYVLRPGDIRHQSLNPFRREQNWRQFGNCILQYAKSGVANQAEHLADFFAISELITSKEECAHLHFLSANWAYAFLLYNAHQNCESAQKRTDEYDEKASAEEVKTAFDENVWESLDASFFEGIPAEEIRNCYAPLEAHMVGALCANDRIRLSNEQFEELVKRAFTLQLIRNVTLRDHLQADYQKLLLRDGEDESGSAFERILDLMSTPSIGSLLSSQPKQLVELVKASFDNYDAIPTAEQMRTLAEYAGRGEEESKLVTNFAIDLLGRGVSYSKLKVFRPVQCGDVLDNAILDDCKKYDQIHRCVDLPFRASFIEYAEEASTANAIEESQLKKAFASILMEYIKNHAGEYRSELKKVVDAFDDIGMKKSPDLMEVLIECIDSGDQPFTNADVEYVVQVLDFEENTYAEKMLEVLHALFEKALPDMFEHEPVMPDSLSNVIDICWTNCITRTAGEMRNELRNRFANSLHEYVSNESEHLHTRLPKVVQAFRDLGPEGINSEAAQQALCILVEEPDMRFTVQNANLVLPVLKSNDASAKRMADAILMHFALELPDLVQNDSNPKEHPWKICISDVKLSEAQQYLAQEMRNKLLAYANEKPNELVRHLSRIVALLKAYDCTDAEQIAVVCCNVFQSQAKYLEEEALLSQTDYDIFSELNLRNVSDASKEQLVQALHVLFEKQLSVLAQVDGAFERWIGCFKNKHLSEELKGKAQQTFVDYADNQANKLGRSETEDDLLRLLRTVEGLEWTHAEEPRKAIANYFCKLQRSELSESEISVLLSCSTRPQNREIREELEEVFFRAVPRIVMTGDAENEATLWEPVMQEIDLRASFQKAIEVIRNTPPKENTEIGESVTLFLLGLGEKLGSLRETAIEQAIALIGDRKTKQHDTTTLVPDLLSENEHLHVGYAVLNSGNQRLVNQYIDLLAFEPNDPENTDNEKQLRKKMQDKRKTLFGDMSVDTANYAVKKNPIWQLEVQQALLDKLKSATGEDGLSFNQLCEIPDKWEEYCKDMPFVQFADITRFVPDHRLLEEAVDSGVVKTVQNAKLDELKTNPFQGMDTWYATVVNLRVAQRLGTDIDELTQECETPADLKDLLDMLDQSNASAAPEVVDALKLVQDGGNTQDVLITLSRLKNLGDTGIPVAISLLRKSIFGVQNHQWKEQWDSVDYSSRIPYAAICYLFESEPMWDEFFKVLFEDTTMEKKAFAMGSDPTQALVFASSVLQKMQLNARAEEMVEQLMICRREIYTYVRGIGCKRKELAALKNPNAWKETGATEDLYQLLFYKK